MARPMQDPNIRIDEILDVAEPLFFTNGYKKTTITDITNKMGVAKGMIYYYFRSKEEILEAIINRQTQVLLIHIKEIVSSQEKILCKNLNVSWCLCFGLYNIEMEYC